MMPTIHSVEELCVLERSVERAAASAAMQVETLLKQRDGLALLYDLKFRQAGFHPLDSTPLNFIEQLNQTFTYLTSLRGLEILFERHAGVAPFTLNLGTAAGYDIVSSDESVVAEVFAAVLPNNNDKLKKDIRRVAQSQAEHKYVVFHCPNITPGLYSHASGYPEVQVICVGLPGLGQMFCR